MANVPLSKSLEEWVGLLDSEDSAKRLAARERLIAMGGQAVPALCSVLENNPRSHARWEAATALSKLKDPEAVPCLVMGLDDEAVAVRWLASEGLVHLGDRALVGTLRGLLNRAGSPNYRESAERVLRHIAGHTMHGDVIRPVLDALEQVAAAEAAPTTAERALDTLRHRGVYFNDEIERLAA